MFCFFKCDVAFFQLESLRAKLRVYIVRFKEEEERPLAMCEFERRDSSIDKRRKWVEYFMAVTPMLRTTRYYDVNGERAYGVSSSSKQQDQCRTLYQLHQHENVRGRPFYNVYLKKLKSRRRPDGVSPFQLILCGLQKYLTNDHEYIIYMDVYR